MIMNNDVMRDVVFRTNGEVYIGVVGPVRSGKSTFIRKFIESKVTPYINDKDLLSKVVDDLPQSGEGKSIMTVEPKFIPSNPVYINIDNNINMNVRLVDCVGYVIDKASGYINQDGTPRLVETPWQKDSIPFVEAASIGTKKVIENHSHIGILLTSDGSFGDFQKEDYQKVEEELVNELKSINKPFVIVLNTIYPTSTVTLQYVDSMKEKYGVSVISCDCKNMNNDDIDNILSLVLSEFEISKLEINVPSWIRTLDDSFPVKQEFNDLIDKVTLTYRKIKDIEAIKESLKECRLFTTVDIMDINNGTGEILIDIQSDDDLYIEVLESIIGDVVNDKAKFINFLAKAKENDDLVNQYIDAIKSCQKTGYGIAIPKTKDMILDKPEVIKVGSRYGIRLKAIAPSIHMIKIDVESTFEPIIGSIDQSNDLIKSIENDVKDNPDGIWDSAIFGRKLSDLVSDGVKAKLYLLNENTQFKFKESLEKVVNKGKGGLLAIIL